MLDAAKRRVIRVRGEALGEEAAPVIRDDGVEAV